MFDKHINICGKINISKGGTQNAKAFYYPQLIPIYQTVSRKLAIATT